MGDAWSVEPLGERALLACLRGADAIQTNLAVHALARSIAVRRPSWLEDLVPAYASVALILRSEAADRDTLEQAQRLVAELITDSGAATADIDAPVVEIPVYYGGIDGPDLEATARLCGISPEHYVERHCAGEYQVAMLGFAPGFAYLLGLDPALSAPRLATPRRQVPAGSLGIAGDQTGIYPQASPGGWRLIGRTTTPLFDPTRDPPSALQPGDRVRFVPRVGAASRT